MLIERLSNRHRTVIEKKKRIIVVPRTLVYSSELVSRFIDRALIRRFDPDRVRESSQIERD